MDLDPLQTTLRLSHSEGAARAADSGVVWHGASGTAAADGGGRRPN